ncbi:MAG: peptidoglycan-binding protein [Lachnospiraceae bacterium]|nr:peptidoglycan-binding protein [Lachnospiraceae bacterium]
MRNRNNSVKLVSFMVLAFLIMNIIVFQTYAMTKEEVLQKVNESIDNYSPGEILNENDFIVFTDYADYEKYDENILLSLLSEYGKDSGLYYFFLSDEESEMKPDSLNLVYTYRGVDLYLGSREDVDKAYGAGIEGKFDKETDKEYIGLKESGDAYVDEWSNKAVSYILYSYNDVAQIKFYFDENDKICFTAYLSGIWETADKETTKNVQEVLNSLGYDCGTPDGIAGDMTKTAVSKYQEDHGLYVSGNIDDSLIKSLKDEEINTIAETEVPEDTISADDTIESDFNNILLRLKDLSDTIQISEKSTLSGASGVAVQLNGSRFNLIYNSDDEGFSIGIMLADLDNDSGGRDTFEIYTLLTQSVDTSLSYVEAMANWYNAYINGEYKSHGVTYVYLDTSASLMLKYTQ